jgi:hypothetical protein
MASNMSYCRFQNTLRDLRDCYYNMNDNLSGDEDEARQGLIELCEQILTECCDDVKVEYPGAKIEVKIYEDEEN